MFKNPLKLYAKIEDPEPGPDHYSPYKLKKSKYRKYKSCFNSLSKRELSFLKNDKDLALAGPGRYNHKGVFRKTNLKFNVKNYQPNFMPRYDDLKPKQYGEDLKPVVYRTLKPHKN